MAKSTRGDGKRTRQEGPVAVMEMPAPASEPTAEPETQEPEGQPEAQETAGQPGEDLQKKKERFFNRLTRFPRSLWENELVLYVYRLGPITDRRASGEQVRNIAKLSEPIDEDYILKEKTWGGSGVYRIMLNRRKPGESETKCIDSIWSFEIENQAYPPCVPPGEWVDDPRNKRWAWARPKDPATSPAVQAAPQQTGMNFQDALLFLKGARELASADREQNLTGTNMVDLINATLTTNNPEKIMGLAVKIAEMMKPAQPSVDPLQQLTATITALKGLMPQPAAPADPMEQLKNMAETLKSLMPPPPPPPPPAPDPVTQIKAQAETIKTLREVFGEGEESGPARRSNMAGWQEMLQPLFGQIGPVLTLIGQAVVHKLTAGPGAPAPPASVTGATPSGTFPPAQQPQNGGGTAVPPNEDLAAHITQWINPTLTQHLSNGWSGEEFAETLANSATSFKGIPIAGTFVYHQLKAAGKEALGELCKKNPAIWATVPQPQEENLSRFLDEFLSWDPNAEDEPEPPPPAPTKGGRKGAAQ